MYPCSDPEFELHNLIDYVRLLADFVSVRTQLREAVTIPGTKTPIVAQL